MEEKRDEDAGIAANGDGSSYYDHVTAAMAKYCGRDDSVEAECERRLIAMIAEQCAEAMAKAQRSEDQILGYNEDDAGKSVASKPVGPK